MIDPDVLRNIESVCPHCASVIPGPFPVECPHCDFHVRMLADMGTTRFQRKKWREHSDILQGVDIQLYGKTWNASFDHRGYANLQEIVRFALTYGDGGYVTSAHGDRRTPVIGVYIPEIIGSGTGLYQTGSLSCSGVCIISPGSTEWAHTYPVLDPWVQQHFGEALSVCRFCGAETAWGQPICGRCYDRYGAPWTEFLPLCGDGPGPHPAGDRI